MYSPVFSPVPMGVPCSPGVNQNYFSPGGNEFVDQRNIYWSPYGQSPGMAEVQNVYNTYSPYGYGGSPFQYELQGSEEQPFYSPVTSPVQAEYPYSWNFSPIPSPAVVGYPGVAPTEWNLIWQLDERVRRLEEMVMESRMLQGEWQNSNDEGESPVAIVRGVPMSPDGKDLESPDGKNLEPREVNIVDFHVASEEIAQGLQEENIQLTKRIENLLSYIGLLFTWVASLFTDKKDESRNFVEEFQKHLKSQAPTLQDVHNEVCKQVFEEEHVD